MWEPGARRWLVERRRIGLMIRALERATDPLFRYAGMPLDWHVRAGRRAGPRSGVQCGPVPQQRLYFLPEPHGHGSLRPVFPGGI
jgi:hypothetical protein